MQRPGCMLQPCCNLYKGTCGRPSAATARRFSKPLRARSASARPPPEPSTQRTLCEYSRATCVRTPEYPVWVRCSLHPVSPLGVRSPCSAGTAAGMVATDAGITCNAYKGAHRLIRPRSAERASCKRRPLRCRVRAPLVLCRAQYALTPTHVPVQMWLDPAAIQAHARLAQSPHRCGRGGPNPGADAAGKSVLCLVGTCRCCMLSCRSTRCCRCSSATTALRHGYVQEIGQPAL